MTYFNQKKVSHQCKLEGSRLATEEGKNKENKSATEAEENEVDQLTKEEKRRTEISNLKIEFIKRIEEKNVKHTI